MQEAGAAWGLHRTVLSALLQGQPAGSALNQWDATGALDKTILDFVDQHGLAIAWLALVRSCRLRVPLNEWDSAAQLRLERQEKGALALYLSQSATILELSGSLDQEAIRHAFFKGTAWRDEIYDRPHARTATDIDLLIDAASLPRCRSLLAARGFRLVAEGRRGHEESWVRGAVDVDLHWRILAPGRLPTLFEAAMLERRVRTSGGFWRLCNEDMVAVALMHLAVSKYVCSRHAGLNRILDLLLVSRRLATDWARVAEVTADARLNGAAWATLCWIDCLVDTSPSGNFGGLTDHLVAAIRPSAWRAAYLSGWVNRDLPGKLEPNAAWLVRFAFTLPMHDDAAAAFGAVAHRLRGARQ